MKMKTMKKIISLLASRMIFFDCGKTSDFQINGLAQSEESSLSACAIRR
jgi:hypothetical protein